MASIRSSSTYRIITACAAIVVWMFIVSESVIYFTLATYLDREREREIRAELDRFSDEPNHSERLRELRRLQTDGASAGLGYALFNPDGKLVSRTIEIERPVRGF